jgi:hypothetical protein
LILGQLHEVIRFTFGGKLTQRLPVAEREGGVLEGQHHHAGQHLPGMQRLQSAEAGVLPVHMRLPGQDFLPY